MDWDEPDRADEGRFNAILWHSIKGADVPMPAPKTVFRHGHRDDDD